MKKLAVVLSAATVLAGGNLWAKKAVDLSEFDGRFKGKGTLVTTEGSFLCTARAEFDVAKNGKSAKVHLTGTLNGAGVTVPIDNEILLKRNGTETTSNVIVLNIGTRFAAAGKYRQQTPTKVKGSTTVPVMGGTAVQETTFVVKPKGKNKRRLKTTVILLIDGVPTFTFNFALTGR